MNTLNTIQKCEQALVDLPQYENYTLVCFGASTASKRALKVLQSLKIYPKYVCDNDSAKQGHLFEGYEVSSPESLFSKPLEFFVIITSMYYSEIMEQLSFFSKVKGSVFYLDVIATDIALSSTMQRNELLLMQEVKQTPFELFIRYDKLKDTDVYATELSVIKAHGIKGFIDFEQIQKKGKAQYLNYTSHANAFVLGGTLETWLPLIETKYNFNELNYQKLLEYCLFERYRRKMMRTKLIIDSWELFKKGQFLAITSHVLNLFSLEKIELIESTQKLNKQKKHALIFHLYHVDMFDEIADELVNCIDIFDIYISVTITCNIEDIRKIISVFPEAKIFLFENRGRDILPFLNILKEIDDLGYSSICKVHTKKSIYQKDGKDWGKFLRTELFQAKDEIVTTFEKENSIGAFVAKNNVSSMHKYLDANKKNVKFVSKLLGVPYREDFTFPVGTMFWARADVLSQLLNVNLDEKYFTLEGDSLDGHIEHAIERIVGLLIKFNGYEIKET